MNNAISVCLIVKNEEKHIENCLYSLKDLVDEIIVVDTGSEDKTKEIVKKFTNKLFDFKWNNNFSEARNFAISKASRDWILSIDADETISIGDIKKMKNLFYSYPDADAFVFNLRTYTNDQGVIGWQSSKDDFYSESKCASGFYTAKLLRLFKNKRGFLFEGRIHETPHKSINEKNGKIYDSDIVLHHFGALNQEKLKEKKEMYINILKERLNKKEFSEKKEDYICFELGKELLCLDKKDEAFYFFKKAIEINESFDYLLAIAGLYIEKEDLNNAEKILKKANEMMPGNPSLNNNLGIVYAKKQEFNKSIRKLNKAIELEPKFADAYFNLALVYQDLGEKNKMQFYLEKAVELNPTYKSYIKTL